MVGHQWGGRGENTGASGRIPRCRLLVADDDRDTRLLWQDALRASKTLKLAELVRDGSAAVAAFESMESPPDVVILDHHMPRMTGLEAASRILAVAPGTKIIITSADHSIRERVLECGVAHFVAKPFSLRRLLSLVRRLHHAARAPERS